MIGTTNMNSIRYLYKLQNTGTCTSNESGTVYFPVSHSAPKSGIVFINAYTECYIGTTEEYTLFLKLTISTEFCLSYNQSISSQIGCHTSVFGTTQITKDTVICPWVSIYAGFTFSTTITATLTSYFI